jgi:hypothetical protein
VEEWDSKDRENVEMSRRVGIGVGKAVGWCDL